MKIFNRLNLFVLISLSISFVSCFSLSSPSLTTLLDDVKLYTFNGDGTKFIHAGDLYQHSMWTYYAMIDLQKDSQYAANLTLTKREYEILPLAGLLHDIGKAGRDELFDKTHPCFSYKTHKNTDNTIIKIDYWPDRQEHPLIGFRYVAAHLLVENSAVTPDFYRLANGLYFNFHKLFEELKMTRVEQQLVALLVGIHYDFGNFKGGSITAAEFMKRLQKLVTAINYNNNVIDEKLLRLSIIVQASDVKGLVSVPCCCSPLFPDTKNIDATHNTELEVADPFCTFGYEHPTETLTDTKNSPKELPLALRKMRELLNYYHKNYPIKQLEIQKATGSTVAFA